MLRLWGLDGTGRHASTCALGEAARGHNTAVDTLYQYAKLVDPDAALEPREVVTTQDRLLPADILSTAFGRLMAADLGVTSPVVAAMTEEAKQGMVDSKKSGAGGHRRRAHQGGHSLRAPRGQPLRVTAPGA